MKGLTLTQQEQGRSAVLNQVLQHHIDIAAASRLLGLSERQTWRILAAYRAEGAAALAHGNRGRTPVNALPREVTERVVALAQGAYRGANHTHFTELLAEREQLDLARTTVRGILVRAGVQSPRHRRPPKHRLRRERLPQEGMLLQIDGSQHAWLEDRGPKLTLLLAVDDATGTYPWAVFREQEDLAGYLLLLQGIIERCGIPLALYSDRHTVFRAAGAPADLPQAATQFGRAMQELGVTQVFAMTPEAKRRVERANRTLQDRLVTELRLAGATTLEAANQVLWTMLPLLNRRFGVRPAQEGLAYRPLGTVELVSILCSKDARKVARDNTVKFRRQTLQLLPTPARPTYAGATVEVQLRLNGTIVLCHEGEVLAFREAPPRPAALRSPDAAPVHGEPPGPSLRDRASSPHDVLGFRQPPPVPPLFAEAQAPSRRRRAPASPKPPQPTPRQQARWYAVRAGQEQGLSVSAISRGLNIDRKTVRRYLGAAQPPANAPRQRRTSDRNKQLTESLVS